MQRKQNNFITIMSLSNGKQIYSQFGHIFHFSSFSASEQKKNIICLVMFSFLNYFVTSFYYLFLWVNILNKTCLLCDLKFKSRTCYEPKVIWSCLIELEHLLKMIQTGFISLAWCKKTTLFWICLTQQRKSVKTGCFTTHFVKRFLHQLSENCGPL